MPIYAYRCETCGHAKDVLQKMSDPVLTTCPSCGAEAFKKQVTAAGFQLKGSGWYVTDFRGGTTGAPAEKADETATTPAATATAEAAKSTDAASPAPASAPAASPSTGSTASAPATSPASPPKAA